MFLILSASLIIFLVSLPSYCLGFNAADERSLLEIVLYCISKLAVITSRYFYINTIVKTPI